VDIQEKNELHLQINDHIHNVDHPSNCVPYINIDIKATTSMTSLLYVKMENYPNFFLSEGKSIVSDNTCILDIQVLTSQFHVAGLNVIGVSVFSRKK
jgi:hypothetical protein